jgi:hypothetical protein
MQAASTHQQTNAGTNAANAGGGGGRALPLLLQSNSSALGVEA